MPAESLMLPDIAQARPAPILLTARDAARALAVCERTLWGLTQRGEIPRVLIGRAVRYRYADLLDWAARHARTQKGN